MRCIMALGAQVPEWLDYRVIGSREIGVVRARGSLAEVVAAKSVPSGLFWR